MDVKILIVEDEMLVAEDLADYMRDCGFLVTGIANSSEACFEQMNNNPPDLVIMDIAIKGGLDGIELALVLKENGKLPVIFLTANSDALTIDRALTLSPEAFITKPFNRTDLKVAISLACQKHNQNVMQQSQQRYDITRDSIFIKEGLVYKRIEVHQILYIEAKGSYSNVVTATKTYILSYNLNYFKGLVKNPVFRKVHRSYIVNIDKVSGFDSTSVIINKVNIPVSKQYQKETMNLFLKL